MGVNLFTEMIKKIIGPTSSVDGLMTQSIVSEYVDLENCSQISIFAKWPSTGSPQGSFGLAMGPAPGIMFDLTSSLGSDPEYKGSVPGGSGNTFWMDFRTGAKCLEFRYNRTGGGSSAAADQLEVWVMGKP
jgi:hypothetical protein